MANRIGRPSKYASLIQELDNQTLYSPRMIGELGHEQFFPGMARDSGIIKIQRAMERRAERHYLTQKIDAKIGNQKENAWYGSTWKETIQYEIENDGAKHPAPEKLPRARRWRLAIAALGAFSLLVGATTIALGPSKVSQVYQNLWKKGVNEALREFEASEDAVMSQSERVAKAWAHIYAGEYSLALEVLDQGTYSEDPWSLAQLNFCYGYIEQVVGNLDQSEKYYRESLYYYESLGLEQDVNQVKLSLAQVLIDKYTSETPEKLTEAEAILQTVFVTRKDWISLLYSKFARISFEQGNLALAIDQALQARNLASENPTRRAEATCELGFFYMLSGEYNLGLRYTDESEKVFLSTGDMLAHKYTYFNRLVYRICNGMPTRQIWSILESDDQVSNPAYARWIHFLKDYRCTEDRPSPQRPPEPPSGPPGGGGGSEDG